MDKKTIEEAIDNLFNSRKKQIAAWKKADGYKKCPNKAVCILRQGVLMGYDNAIVDLMEMRNQ